MRISDWSSDVCSSDLIAPPTPGPTPGPTLGPTPGRAPPCLSRESEGVGRELFMNDVPAAGVRGAAGGLRGAWPATGKLARHPPRVSPAPPAGCAGNFNLSSRRSEEHTSELQSLMRTSYAVF